MDQDGAWGQGHREGAGSLGRLRQGITSCRKTGLQSPGQRGPEQDLFPAGPLGTTSPLHLALPQSNGHKQGEQVVGRGL